MPPPAGAKPGDYYFDPTDHRTKQVPYPSPGSGTWSPTPGSPGSPTGSNPGPSGQDRYPRLDPNKPWVATPDNVGKPGIWDAYKSPGALGRPGYGEQYYDQYRSTPRAPSRGSSYWDQVRGRFTGQGGGAQPYQPPPSPFDQYFTPNSGTSLVPNGSGGDGRPPGAYNPTATRDAYGTARNQLTNPGAGETNVRGVTDQLNRPGMGEAFARSAIGSGYFDGPGEAERYYNAVSGGLMTTGAGVNNVRRIQDQFNRPGAAEDNLGYADDALSRINYGDNALGFTGDVIGGARSTGDYYDEQLRGFSGQNPVGDEYGYFSDGLRNKSYTENIFESGSGGLIDPYARAQEKQTRNIRNAAASRGMFGTGASLRLEQELGADIAAEEARDRIELARSADDQRLARTAGAMDFTRSAADVATARRRLGLEGAMGADDMLLRGGALGLDAFGLASDEALRRVDLRNSAADSAQRNQIDRLFRGGTLGLEADASDRERIALGGDLADRAQGRGIERYNTGSEIASRGQNNEVDRLFRSGSLGLDADRAARERMDSLMRGARDVDDVGLAGSRNELDWISRGADIAGGLDAEDRYRTNDEFGMAERTQRLMEGRLRGGLDDISGNVNNQVNALLGQLPDIERQRFQAEIDDINARAQAEGWSAQQTQQAIDQVLGSVRTLIQTRGGGR